MTNHLPPVVDQGLTQFQLGLIVVGLFLAIVILIGIIFWVSRRYPKKKEKLDPVYKGVFLVLIIFLVHAAAVAIGVLTIDSIQDNLHWYGLAIVLAIIFYMAVGYFAKRTIPGWKLWKLYVLPEVNKFFKGSPYKGVGYADPVTYHRVLEVAKSRFLREEGVDAEKVQVFLGRAIFSNVFIYIAVANKHTGEVVMLHKNPPLSIQQELLGKDFVPSYSN